MVCMFLMFPKIGVIESGRLYFLSCQSAQFSEMSIDIFLMCLLKLSMYNKIRNRGLAFITMSSPEEALAAFSNLESYVSILHLKDLIKRHFV